MPCPRRGRGLFPDMRLRHASHRRRPGVPRGCSPAVAVPSPIFAALVPLSSRRLVDPRLRLSSALRPSVRAAIETGSRAGLLLRPAWANGARGSGSCASCSSKRSRYPPTAPACRADGPAGRRPVSTRCSARRAAGRACDRGSMTPKVELALDAVTERRQKPYRDGKLPGEAGRRADNIRVVRAGCRFALLRGRALRGGDQPARGSAA